MFLAMIAAILSETFRADKLEDFLGFKIDFCQDNESRSSYGVLRGLHYQMPPFAQTKLITGYGRQGLGCGG